MSVIQTIRNKYLGLMIGVIVLALVGFLLMDAVQSNSSNLFGSNDNSYANVNGAAIGAEDVKTAEEKYLARARQQNPKMTEQEQEEVKNQAWDDLVTQKLLDGEFEKLGITCGDKEKQAMLLSAYPDDMVRQNFTDPATGVFDPTRVKQFADQAKAGKDTAARKQWVDFVDGLCKQRIAQKYNALVGMGTYMPKGYIDAKVAERNTVAAAEFVKIAYDSIPNDKVKVTDEDVNAFISKYSTAFTLQEPMRKADYVAFDVIPTPSDTQASLGVLNTNMAEFGSTTNMAEFLSKYSDFGYDELYHAAGDGNSPLADSMGKGGVGSITGPYFEDGYYKMFKVLDKKDVPDSARATHLLIAPNQSLSMDDAEKKIDSLLKVVQGGGDLAQLASQLSDDGGSKQKGGDLGFFPFGMVGKDFTEFTFYGKKGELKKVKSNYGWHIVRITDQKDFKMSARVAIFAKALKASENTINAVYAKANDFAGKCDSKESFEKNIKAAGLTKRVAEGMMPTASNVAGLGSSRELVRWAFSSDSKVGALSGIKSAKNGLIDRYVVAVLTEKIEKGLAPASLVRERLEGELRNQKKAKYIADMYKGNDLAAIAGKAGKAIGNADTVLLAGTMNPVLGNEPKVIGACFDKNNMGKTSAAIQGNEGVYFVKVKTVTPSNIPATEADYARERGMMNMQLQQNLGRSLPAILKKKANIKDNRGKLL